MKSPSEAVLAEFVDCRSVKTRSVLQLVLEIPIEQANDALLALGGWPQPSKSRWVGVALAPKERKHHEGELIETDPKNPLVPKRKFEELPLSQQAALRCADIGFAIFLLDYGITHECPPYTKDTPQYVRDICHVSSRSEFDNDKEAAARWRMLDSQFKLWQSDKRYAASINK